MNSVPLTQAELRYFDVGRSEFRQNEIVGATNMPSDVNPFPIYPSVTTIDEEDWDAVGLDEANAKWHGRTYIHTILDVVTQLPPNHRTTIDLTGWPLGYLCYRIARAYRAAHMNMNPARLNRETSSFLHGLVLTGTCRSYDHHTMANEPGRSRITVDEVNIHEFPLEKIEFFNPQKVRYRHATNQLYNDPTVDELVGEFSRYLHAIQNQTGGSSMKTFVLWENCSIARRTRPPIPNYMFRKHYVTRTGGFGNLLTSHCKKTFVVDDETFTVFIPSGDINCFDACIRWGYKKYMKGQAFSHMNQEAELETPMTTQAIYEEVDHLMTDIKANRCGRMDRKRLNEYKTKMKVGYTSQELKKLTELYSNEGVKVHATYLGTYGQISNCAYVGETRNKSCEIFIMKMMDNGLIQSAKHMKTCSASGLLHAICIYPIPEKLFINPAKPYITRFIAALEEKTCQYMESVFSETKYKENLSADDLLDFVTYQKKRYNDQKTKTLIFNNTAEALPQSGKRKRWQEEYADKYDHVVFAYDLETVTNTAECQPSVWEPFRVECNLPYTAPIMTQIPFSAQWAPVNVKDSGRYLNRKIEAGVEPREEETDETSPPIEAGCIYGRTDDVLLEDVQTEYGDYQLGKCVEDMLLKVAEYTRSKGAKFAYMFAHNGVGFDSYVVLQFNRFKIKNILKTPRGILSMSVMVPINEDSEDDICITFRDTKVHVPGSLASLCKCFDVPKKWRKIDFPITMVHAGNCYKEEVLEISKDYGENDVRCLAFIIKRINEMIMDSDWDPAHLFNKPPICQFLTTMSMVKAATFNHFAHYNQLKGISMKTHAVDIPILRNWLTDATFGGRVNAYARTYMHHSWNDIMEAFMKGDTETLKGIHKKLLEDQSAMQVLDVTSLYPTAQAQCPMPCGELYFASAETCEEAIQAIHCATCETNYSLCERHNGKSEDNEMRPFLIIVVKNCVPSKDDIRCMAARKIKGKSKAEGLMYSLETLEEVNTRYGKEKMKDQQSYTNVDLYWMRKQGYTFTIIGGFGWEVNMAYNSFIEPAFLKRIEAKKAGNKVLSNTLKLMYNSTYGITVQKDIVDSSFILQPPPELHDLHHTDERVSTFVNSDHNKVGCDEYLDDSIPLKSGQTYYLKKKKAHLAEFFDSQSPSQIGAAVLAWARHIMNLVMFACPVVHCQTYTDTDSICIHDSFIQNNMKKIPGLVDNRTDAYLGSLKNDHLEGPGGEDNGKEPRVVLSLIGTKKVKLHITLNEDGVIKVFNTFKGLNPSNVHPDTKKKMCDDYMSKMVTDSIIHIHKSGGMPAVSVNQWNRSMNTGVLIRDHIQTCDKKTYLGHSQGSYLTFDRVKNAYEMFLPHGYRFVNVHHNPVFLYQSDDKKNYTVLGNREVVIQNQCFSHDHLFRMIEKYYPDWEKEYKVDSVEYERIVEVLLKQ